MVNSCCAWNCTYRYKKGSGVSMHEFPHKNPQLLQKWVKAIRREKWFPNQSSVLCSTHFSDDYFVEGKKNTRLKKDAVPSIFNFSEHLQEDTNTKMKKRKSPKKRLLSSSSWTFTSKVSQICQF